MIEHVTDNQTICVKNLFGCEMVTFRSYGQAKLIFKTNHWSTGVWSWNLQWLYLNCYQAKSKSVL